jgi:hypothetical protein
MQTIIIGAGKIVSSCGTSNGYPAVILENAKDSGGIVGAYAPKEKYEKLEEDSVILEIHDISGLQVILENAQLAIENHADQPQHSREWYAENDPQSLVDSINATK